MKETAETQKEELAKGIGALIDGELDENEVLALEKRLFSELSARSLFRGMADDDRRLKQAFLSSRQEGSAELMATIDQGFRERRGAPSGFAPRQARSWWIQAAAAVVLVVGSAYSTMQLMENRLDKTLTAFAAQAEADRRLVGNALRQALETKGSGQRVSMEEFGGAGGSVTPIRTYKSVSGHWCREYVRDIQLDGRLIDVRGVACRTSDGEWVTVSANPDKEGKDSRQGI